MDEERGLLKLGLAAVAIIGALVLGFGFLFKSGDNSVNGKSGGQISPWAQQQSMMRDAMQMARESQELARERMDMHRREMEMYEQEMYGEMSDAGEFEGE